MNIAMIYPTVDSENAMSNYSLDLIEAIEKTKLKINKGEYTFHEPSTLFKKLPLLKKNDVIHIQHEYNILGWGGLPFFPLLLFLKLFFKGKTVLTLHNVPSKKTRLKENLIKSFLRKSFYYTQNKWIKYFADHVIVHCYHFKKILVDEYGFNDKKLNVIPQAIKQGIKTVDRNLARKSLKLSGKVYLIIGTFVPAHGAADVVKQANRINGKILIVTNASTKYKRNTIKVLDYLNYVKALAKNPEIGKNVRFDLKEVPFSLWWKYFSASDLVLLPYKEGLASGIFSDAIAMNIPMVGSDISYFKEFSEKYGILELAKNGDYAKAIDKAMSKPNYKRMKSRMKSYVREFGVDSIGKKYKTLYEKLLYQ